MIFDKHHVIYTFENGYVRCSCFKMDFLIGVQLLCSVVFIPTVQQSESAICIPISPLFFFLISFSFRPPQNSEQSSLCYSVGSHQLSNSYIVSIVYICEFQSISPHFLPLVSILSFCMCVVFISALQIRSSDKPQPFAEGHKCALRRLFSKMYLRNQFPCSVPLPVSRLSFATISRSHLKSKCFAVYFGVPQSTFSAYHFHFCSCLAVAACVRLRSSGSPAPQSRSLGCLPPASLTMRAWLQAGLPNLHAPSFPQQPNRNIIMQDQKSPECRIKPGRVIMTFK